MSLYFEEIIKKGGAWKDARVIGNQLLLLGDCVEIMSCLPVVDGVLTDPPYGISQDKGFIGVKEREVKGRGTKIPSRRYEGGWDKERPSPCVFHKIRNISKKQIIWGGQFFADILPAQGKWLFWDKCMTMPSFSDGELAWTNLDGVSIKKFTYNGNGLMAKEKDRVHPTQKPLALMEWCLSFLPKEQTILDPFMGSGTTLVACQRLGKLGIGIELDENYFEIACRRVKQEYDNPPLFAIELAPTPPEQQSFL